MAAADQQFLDALKYLGQTGQAFGIKQQMDDVNSRAQEIQSTMTNEIDRRQALRQLATTASIGVAGSGGNAQQAAAIQNLLPVIPTSVQSAYLQGSLTGDHQMVGVAKQMQDEDEARQVKAFQRKAAFQMQLEMQKEKGKPNPEQMAILKENRKKYEDLTSGKQAAIETMAKLNDVKNHLTEMTKSSFYDTGPLDQYVNTDKSQILRTKINDLSLHNMVNMFQGMSKAVDTEPERKAYEATQISMAKYPSANLDQIAQQKAALRKTIEKADRAIYSYKNTGGLSFEAYDVAPTASSSPGFQATPPQSGIKAFYTPAK